jgi:c-di-AMP phosphodiesterase-like protein
VAEEWNNVYMITRIVIGGLFPLKTYSILFIVVALMHTITLVNITIFSGEWNGIVLFLSTTLFVIAVFYYSAEFRANRNRNRSSNSNSYK